MKQSKKSYVFQFYDSPIKRLFSKIIFAHFSCFNSMIVRLKDLYGKTNNSSTPTFQFYDSPIKS